MDSTTSRMLWGSAEAQALQVTATGRKTYLSVYLIGVGKQIYKLDMWGCRRFCCPCGHVELVSYKLLEKSVMCLQDVDWLINPLYCFFGSEGHVALDRNRGPGYNTLNLWMIPGDLLSACPHSQFHTLPGLLDSQFALPKSYPKALCAMQGGSLYHFYDCLWYDRAERRTHDLPCERRTC